MALMNLELLDYPILAFDVEAQPRLGSKASHQLLHYHGAFLYEGFPRAMTVVLLRLLDVVLRSSYYLFPPRHQAVHP